MAIHNATHVIATPSCLATAQPNCAAGALSMYAAEVQRQSIDSSEWGLTNTTVSVQSMLDAWSRVVIDRFGIGIPRSILHEHTEIEFNRPFIWIGIFQGANHAALIYFTPTNALIKNFPYDPNTHTNYMETHDYPWVVSNTLAFYGE